MATGFHGEGFKFSPVVAECVAELVDRQIDDPRAGVGMSALSTKMLAAFDPRRFSTRDGGTQAASWGQSWQFKEATTTTKATSD